MSNSSQSPQNEPITKDNPLPLQPEQSPVLSGFFGPFGLLRSPLFIIITISIASLTALMVDQSQKLEISILLGLFVQLIVTVVIWQFLLLSKRLEDITSRTADLHSQGADLPDFVKTAKQHFGRSRAAHGYSHRMLGEMGGDQSRILQSTEELKRALKLIYDQTEIFCNHIEDWNSQNTEQFNDVSESLDILKSKTDKDWHNQVLKQFDEITSSLATIVDESIKQFMSEQISSVLEQVQTTQTILRTSMHSDIKQSITELNTNLTESLPKKTAQDFNEKFRTQSAEVVSILARLDGQIGKIKGHVSSVEGEVISLANRESNISEALNVSTSLDRLNLEFRRQLVELRKELDIK